MRRAPKDGLTRGENGTTQPLRSHRVFNNPDVVPEGWYPICPSAKLRAGTADSFRIGGQRIAVWRGQDGAVRAVDAFCPHMGADLANGRVVDSTLECYFHQWRYSGSGELVGVRCGDVPSNVRARAWPTDEAYGFIWVYAGDTAPYRVPRPPGLEDTEIVSMHAGKVQLFAHHHAMMAGGIDVQHFASVHGMSAEFEVDVRQPEPWLGEWHMKGMIPESGWRGRIGRKLLGDHFRYIARFAGGSIVTLTYGPDSRLRGTGRPLPAMYILWGCIPLTNGLSEAHIFFVAPRTPGILGGLSGSARLAMTGAMLGVLQDDDVKAFPYMRFQPNRLVALDESVARLMRFMNSQPVSPWAARVQEEPRGDS